MRPNTIDILPDEVSHVARRILKECMGVKPGESVLIVTDTIRKDLGEPIYTTALDMGIDAVYMEMKPRKINSQEPPGLIAEAMYNADVIISMTAVSLTHTQAKINAVKHGARIATMPFGSKSTEFVSKVFTGGGMTVDFEKMDNNIHRLAERLKDTAHAHITTKKGTDVVIDYTGRKFFKDTGIARDPGKFTNLPAGEIYIAPVNANGIVVIDVTLGRLGKLMSPMTLTFKDGLVTSIEGERSEELETILSTHGPGSRNIAELGIGMNPKASVCGLLVEDEKVGGTAHVALGNNHDFGGDITVGLHIDGVMSGPTIVVDGRKLNVREYL